jgi:hypothetical protein
MAYTIDGRARLIRVKEGGGGYCAGVKAWTRQLVVRSWAAEMAGSAVGLGDTGGGREG